MALFETQEVQIDSAAQPVAPVQDTITAGAFNTLGGAIGTASNIFSNIATSKAKSSGDATVSEFQRYKLDLANAVEQGSINSSKAKSLLNSRFSQAVASNPALSKQLGTIYTQGGPAGSSISEGSEAEQLYKKTFETAVENGYVNPEDPEWMQKEDVQSMLDGNKARRDIADIQASLSLKGAVREDVTAEERFQSQQALKVLSSTEPVRFNHSLNKLVKDFKAGTLMNSADSKASMEDALWQLDQMWLEKEALVKNAGQGVGGDWVASLMEPMKSMYESHKSFLSGDISDKALEKSIARQRMIAKNDIFKDQQLLLTSVMSEMYGGVPTDLLVGTTAKLNTFLTSAIDTDQGNGNKPVDPLAKNTSKDGETISKSFEMMDAYLLEGEGVNSVNGKEQTVETFGKFMTNVLDGVDVFKDSVKSPEEFKTLRAWLAQDSTIKFLSENSVQVPSEIRGKVSDILDQGYNDVVIPMIQQAYIDVISKHSAKSASVQGEEPTVTDIEQAVIPVFRGGGVVFKLNPQFESDDSNKGDDVEADLMAKIKELNETVAPIIREDLRVTAALTGNSDFKKVWEEKYEPLFEGNAVDLTEDKKFNLSNFTPIQNLANNIAIDVGDFKNISKDINDKTPQTSGLWNFGKMKGTGLIIHHTGGRGSVDGIVNVFKQRGFPAHYVIDRDGAVHKILGDDQKGQHVKSSKTNDFNNSNSWGVEIIARDDEDVTDVQVEAARNLANHLHEKFGMSFDRVKGHGEVNTHKRRTEGKKVSNVFRRGKESEGRKVSSALRG